MKGLLSTWRNNESPSVMIMSPNTKHIFIDGIWSISLSDRTLILSSEEKTSTYQSEASKIFDVLSSTIISRNDDIRECEKKISEMSKMLGQNDNDDINDGIIEDMSLLYNIIRLHRSKNREIIESAKNIDIAYKKTKVVKSMRIEPNTRTTIDGYNYIWTPIGDDVSTVQSSTQKVIITNEKNIKVDLYDLLHGISELKR